MVFQAIAYSKNILSIGKTEFCPKVLLILFLQEKYVCRHLPHEFADATAVGGDGVGGLGDGPADDDVVGVDLLGPGGSGDPDLVAGVAVREADAGGDGDEL